MKEENKDLPTPMPTAEKTAKGRKWKYVGPPLRRGLYLPNSKLIHPDQIADADLDIYMAQFPEALEGYFKPA